MENFWLQNAAAMIPETRFASWWVSSQKTQPSQRRGKGRVLLATMKGEHGGYFPQQRLSEQQNWGSVKLRVHNTCSWMSFLNGNIAWKSQGPGSRCSIWVTGPSTSHSLMPVGQVSERSEGFRSCKDSSGMVSSQSSLLNPHWEF